MTTGAIRPGELNMTSTFAFCLDGENGGDWEAYTLPRPVLEAAVKAHVLYRCTICEESGYDDNLPTYHGRSYEALDRFFLRHTGQEFASYLDGDVVL